MVMGMPERYTRADEIFDRGLIWSVRFLAILGPILLLWTMII